MIKESDERAAQLTKRYEQALELVTAKAQSAQSTCEHIVRQREQEAKVAREDLEIGMDETRIIALIAKHRQRFNSKIEETLACAWQEWSAHAAELHVLRADAENRRKEGRGFYKMDENNIQILREDLTIEYHHEEFNDDQMLLRLGSEAYECDHIQAEKEEEANIQASTGPMTEEAAQEQPEEEETQQETAQTIEPQ